MQICTFFYYPIFIFKALSKNVPKKKTDYQNGYEDGEKLVVKHVNLDGRSKAKEYIQNLQTKTKEKRMP